MRSLIRIIESYGLSVWLFRDSDWFVRDRHGPHVDREELAVQFSAMVVDDFHDLMEGVSKVVGVSDDYESVARCEDHVHRELGDRVSASRSQPYYLDVTHPKANKGMVLRWFSRYFDIPAQAIAAIGDGPNDVHMFALSGLSIAMGNAPAEVRRSPVRNRAQRSGWICPGNRALYTLRNCFHDYVIYGIYVRR